MLPVHIVFCFGSLSYLLTADQIVLCFRLKLCRSQDRQVILLEEEICWQSALRTAMKKTERFISFRHFLLLSSEPWILAGWRMSLISLLDAPVLADAYLWSVFSATLLKFLFYSLWISTLVGCTVCLQAIPSRAANLSESSMRSNLKGGSSLTKKKPR